MKNGYIEVWLPLDSPFRAMGSKDGTVYEHRLVMAQHLGRCLSSDEEVHHENRDKHDNRIENLKLKSKSAHAFDHYRCADLLARIELLEQENAALRRRLAKVETPDEQSSSA